MFDNSIYNLIKTPLFIKKGLVVSSTEIKAVILAAGKGTRMKSSVPKVLHKIFNKPLLERVLNAVLGITNLTESFVIVGHQADIVAEFINNRYKNNSVSTVLQEPQLGTGDAVFKVYDKLKDFT